MLPKAVTQNGDVMAWLVVVQGEVAAEDWLHTQGPEVIAGYAANGQDIAIEAVGAADEAVVAIPRGQLGEAAGSRAPVEVIGIGGPAIPG